MISLNVAPYCQECDGFDPVKVHTNLYEKDVEIVNVECRYKRRCQAMYRHLETEFKKGNYNA